MVNVMDQIKKQINCIVCPLSCIGEVLEEGGVIVAVTGFSCRRGADYAKEEVIAPKRMYTGTVRIQGGVLPRLPVRSEKMMPKEQIKQCARYLSRVSAQAPVAGGQVICPDILGLGINIIASRDMDTKQE